MALRGFRCPACRTWFEGEGNRPRCPSCGTRASSNEVIGSAGDALSGPSAEVERSTSLERPASLGKNLGKAAPNGPASERIDSPFKKLLRFALVAALFAGIVIGGIEGVALIGLSIAAQVLVERFDYRSK